MGTQCWVCMSAQPPQLLLPRACATMLGWIPVPLAWNPSGLPLDQEETVAALLLGDF